MPQAVSGVVKGARVRLAEPKRLNGLPTGPAARCLPVTARIIDQTADQAVVEVVCVCGAVIHLSCRHEDGPTAGDEQQ